MSNPTKAREILARWDVILGMHLWNGNFGRVAAISGRLERIARTYASR